MSECLHKKNKRIKTWLKSRTPELRPHQKNGNNDCDWFIRKDIYNDFDRPCRVLKCKFNDKYYKCDVDQTKEPKEKRIPMEALKYRWENCVPPKGEVYCDDCKCYYETGINDLVDDHTSQWGGAGPDCIDERLMTANKTGGQK